MESAKTGLEVAQSQLTQAQTRLAATEQSVSDLQKLATNSGAVLAELATKVHDTQLAESESQSQATVAKQAQEVAQTTLTEVQKRAQAIVTAQNQFAQAQEVLTRLETQLINLQSALKVAQTKQEQASQEVARLSALLPELLASRDAAKEALAISQAHLEAARLELSRFEVVTPKTPTSSENKPSKTPVMVTVQGKPAPGILTVNEHYQTATLTSDSRKVSQTRVENELPQTGSTESSLLTFAGLSALLSLAGFKMRKKQD
ncbi:hypothetical protein STRDD10_00425 [Streptococcus sp. DD10]|nr:hypothetical protein STRDD10_00425 [Streptococcus sp. DD10]